MPNEVTPEQIYEEFYRQKFIFKNKQHPRKIKNFEKIKEKNKDKWGHCEKLAQLINRNPGMIDYQIYIEALINRYENSVNYHDLPKHSSISVYKDYAANQKNANKNSYEQLKKSAKFIIKYCIENNFMFNDYLNSNIYGYPDVLKHYNAGSINIIFIAMIPNFNIIFENWQKDVIDDFLNLNEFNKQLFQAKNRIKNDSKFKKWYNLDYNINMLIEKYKEKV